MTTFINRSADVSATTVAFFSPLRNDCSPDVTAIDGQPMSSFKDT